MAAGRPIGHELAGVVSYVPGSGTVSASNLYGYFVDVDGPTTVATANGQGQRNPVGFRQHDDLGNEYIYLAGVASLAAGDWVQFNFTTASLGSAVRLATGATSGFVAVAMAAVVASCWGWFQIYGLTPVYTAIATDAAADGKPLAAGSATGRVVTGATTTKNIFGAVAVGASASNIGTAFISYPYEFGSATI